MPLTAEPLALPEEQRQRLFAPFTWRADDLLVGLGALAVMASLAGAGSYLGHTAAKATRGDGEISRQHKAVANHARVVPANSESDGPCASFSPGRCPEPQQTRELQQQSQYHLHRGDAEVALGRRDEARSFYSRAVVIGRPANARSADLAISRLQFLDLGCSDDPGTAKPQASITMAQQQRALKVLGYYRGRIGDAPGMALTAAIRAFQSDLWLDETGHLDEAQTVLLLCGAAEIAQDATSQRDLGLMYAAGRSVAQDTGRALRLLEDASLRGDGSASWNLALLYGAGMLGDRTPVCGVGRDLNRADQYLADAMTAGDERAAAFGDFVRGQNVRERWRQVAAALRRPGQSALACPATS
ncbi:MAG: peptidoglycan-binding protein [Pseudomonadota bacterium]